MCKLETVEYKRRQCIFSFMPCGMYAFEVPEWTSSCEVIAAMTIKQQVSFINLTVKDAMYLLSILQEWIVLNSDKFLLCCFRPGVL